MRKLGRANLVFAALLAAFGLYAALYIYRTSFIAGGERYFSLFDDAMVSMRYARNLARGNGLVWNPGGERVEGFTNPAWVGLLALFHLLPLAASKVSLLVQLSALGFLAANLFVVRRIGERISGGSQLVALGAVALTAFYLPLNTWSLQGMEVSILTLLVSLSTLLAIESANGGGTPEACPPPTLWPLWLLGAGTLFRLDAAVPYVGVLAYLLWSHPQHWRRTLLWGVLALAAFIGAQTAFRLWYYGDLLPNTYYLKMTGYPLLLRLTRGLYVALDMLWNLNWLVFLLPLTLYLFHRRRPVVLLAGLFLLQVLYSIYVGGDAWEWWGGANRYICIAMPGFMALCALGIETLVQALGAGLPRKLPLLARYGGVALLALAFITLTNFDPLFSRQSLLEWLLIRRPLHVTDNRKAINASLVLNEITTPQATVAVTWAGTMPYYSDRVMIDLLGKCDRVIAHQPMHVPTGLTRFIDFYPGHLKWDYDYSIGRLQPDVVAALWLEDADALSLMANDYDLVTLRGFPFYLRRGSPRVLWDRVAALQ